MKTSKQKPSEELSKLKGRKKTQQPSKQYEPGLRKS